MNIPRKNPAFGAVIYFGIIFLMATYFTFASVQGDYGLFRRVQIDAVAKVLRDDRDHLRQEVAEMITMIDAEEAAGGSST